MATNGSVAYKALVLRFRPRTSDKYLKNQVKKIYAT